jgi:hypothetical protein
MINLLHARACLLAVTLVAAFAPPALSGEPAASTAPPPATVAPLPEVPPTGGTYRLTSPPPAGQLAVGCLNHRTLKFIVASLDGPDPAEAKLLAGRDCRPIDPTATYVRCAPGAIAFPSATAPVTFSSYCRTGAADLHMYIVDGLMEEVK